MSAAGYCGRFAPSPTGPLHFGSWLAALASYLDARHQHGRWLVRIEDLDPPRVQPGAADAILALLERNGLNWDGEVWWQSRRSAQYEAALQLLHATGWLYPCACSRKEVSEIAHAGVEGPVYPDTCRRGTGGRPARAWRLQTPDEPICFDDRIQGLQTYQLHHELGDFVLKRADGLYAYQLAVVVDDAEQHITDVVRGLDLIHSTPRQIWLQCCLSLPTLRYAHLPLALNEAGQKLSKQNLARPIESWTPEALWLAGLDFLGQPVPQELRRAPMADLHAWAVTHWDIRRVPQAGQLSPDYLSP